MAYTRSKLQRIGPVNRNAPSLYMYTDSANLTAIDATGYFNDAADILNVGDWILVTAGNGYGIAIVNANSRDLTASPPVRGVVDTTNLTAVGTIDSD